MTRFAAILCVAALALAGCASSSREYIPASPVSSRQVPVEGAKQSQPVKSKSAPQKESKNALNQTK